MFTYKSSNFDTLCQYWAISTTDKKYASYLNQTIEWILEWFAHNNHTISYVVYKKRAEMISITIALTAHECDWL